MPATEMVVMVAVVAALALSFIHLVRLATTAIMHKTARRMVDRDPASAEAMIERLGSIPENSGDDRLATILIAFGIAMIAGAVVINDPGWMHYAVAGALFPLVIGTALWLRLFILERARRRASRQ
jgi:hypothetical protein